MSRNKPHLACLGDVTLDIVVRASAAVDAGTDVPAAISFRIGGSAANTARAFAAVGGGRAVFLGAVGDDKLGGQLVAGLRAEGVVVHAVRRPGKSARLVVVVGGDGERSFLTDRGVADSLSASAVRPAWLSGVDALHVPAYSLLAEPLGGAAGRAAEIVHSGGRLVSVDLASVRPLMALGRPAANALVGGIRPDILFANSSEATALVGRDGDRRLLELAALVVIKLGADGCRIVTRGHTLEVATKQVVAVDSTGAGDAFDAGFLHALIAGGYSRDVGASPAVLRRAALAGHRAAKRVLTAPRVELSL